MRLVTLRNSNAPVAKNRKRRRGGDREAAMRAINPAGSFNNRAGEHTRLAQQFEADARAHNVHNGIDGTHFMKMDLFGRKAMDFSFGDCDPMEHGDGLAFDPI